MTGLVSTFTLNKQIFASDSDSSDSDSDSDGDSYTVWPRLNLLLCFVMAQNDRAGEYINLKWADFCPDSDSDHNGEDIN